jgi:hypothetical protein
MSKRFTELLISAETRLRSGARSDNKYSSFELKLEEFVIWNVASVGQFNMKSISIALCSIALLVAATSSNVLN